MVCGLAPRKAEELAGQRRAALGCPLDRGNRALRSRVVADPLLEDVQAAADDHQEIVEVVCDAAGQLAECIELLRLRKLLLHPLEPELGLAPLGHVAGDLGEADKLAVLIDGIDDDAGPEEGAVLAHPPAVFLVAALVAGDLQRALRLAVGAVSLGVEAGKMLAEDLLGRVALDALAADIPARDHAGGVKHIKRIVGHPLDEKAEIALTFKEIALSLLVFSEHPSPGWKDTNAS
jgi:hypothetical protein